MLMAVVCEKLGLDYLSPINEPQWNWIHAGQEGMQMTNEECCRLIRCLDKELKKINGNTRVVFGEAGCINYLYEPMENIAYLDCKMSLLLFRDILIGQHGR